MRQTTKNETARPTKTFSPWTLIEKGFFIFLYTIPVAYGISARTLDDYVKYALTIAVISFLLVVSWLYSTRFRLAFEQGRPLSPVAPKHLLIFMAGNVGLSLLMGVVFYSAAASAVDLFDWFLNLNPTANRNQFIGFVGAGVLALGGVFFWGRLRARFTYGLVEASMGVVFAVHRFSAEQQVGFPSNAGFYLAMLTAGVYLVVRGFDNMHQGWKEGKDPLAYMLLRFGSKPIDAKVPRRLLPIDGPRVYGTRRKRGERLSEL